MGLQKNRRILVVDDNLAIHVDFRKILASPPESTDLENAEARLLGYAPSIPGNIVEVFELESAYQGEEGLQMVRASVASGNQYAMAFVDMRMPPGWDGVQTIAKIWEVDPEIQIVICTAYSDYSWEEIIQKLGSVDQLLILKKPFDTIEVCQMACALTQKWHLARHLNQVRVALEERTLSLQAEVIERSKSQEQLHQTQLRYALALAGANDGIWDWDFTTQAVFYSPRWKAMLGESEGGITPTAQEWFNRIHPDDLGLVKSNLDAHIQGRSEQFSSEHRMMHSNGQYRWMHSRGVAVRDESGKVIRAAGSQTDITDRKLAESQLRYDTLHDGLTGLANRTLLMDRINQCLQRVKRAANQLFAVIFVDLDRFKVINDSLGHAAGDQLLIELAKRLESALRAGDTVSRGEGDHLARLGGDEFVALLESIRTPNDVICVAERLQQVTVKPFDIGGHEVCVSASLGIALSNGNYQNPEEILRDADTALYDAKNNAQGSYRFFDPQMHAAAMQRLVMENDLRRGIERGELLLHYQPIISLQTGQIVGAEALVRWEHPERGTISPADFIPLAEETGLILPLSRWVLRNACKQMKAWQMQLPRLHDLSVAVNVSGCQFARTDVAADIVAVLAECGLEARRLKLEITETIIMEGGASATTQLNALRDMGIQCHLDDFGTGYSSLGYLNRMPIHVLKIDRSFIAGLAGNGTELPIVKAILAMAHSLDMQVVAEGVEHQSQAESLRDLGCDLAQGYYFARPLAARQFLDFADDLPNREKAEAEVAA